MIIHHMADGSIRKNIDGVILPKQFENIYKLANRRKKDISNGNVNTSRTVERK